MTTRTGRQWTSLAWAAVAISAPSAAFADLGEFTWSGREGSGRLVWNLDTPDSDPSPQRATFADGIVSFDFTGSLWGMPGEGIHLSGAGGSYRSSWAGFEPDCHTSGGPCNTAELQFDLGAARPGDPARYTLSFTTQFALDKGRFPTPLPGRAEDARWLNGALSNDLDDRVYLVFDVRSQGETRVVAAPVPEPGTWALFGIGAALLAARGSARGRPNGPSGGR